MQLMVRSDFSKHNERILQELADLGPYIAVLKTHVDVVAGLPG